MKTRSRLPQFCLSVSLVLLAALPPALAENFLNDPLVQSIVHDIDEVRLVKGELVVVDVSNLERVSVGDPDIADIISAEDDTLEIIGKAEGRTSLFIWDEGGKRVVTVYVASENLDETKARIDKLLASSGIRGVKSQVNHRERRVILTGQVAPDKMDIFDQITAPFADEGLVLALAGEVKSKGMVQVDMQITEVNTTFLKNLGIDWHSGSVSDSPFAIDLVETLPTFNERSDLFNIGRFGRSAALLARINAMVEEGNAKILSRPKLVVTSGEEASFLVGGEIPIRNLITQVSGTQAQEIVFKEYGTGLTLTPTINEDHTIDILLYVDISDIDRTNAVGEDVAYTLRSAQTRLFLKDGETVVLAGLIKNTKNETLRRIPYVSKIPVLGFLFRSKTMPTANQDTDLVIAMTPHILGQEFRAGREEQEDRVEEAQPVPAPTETKPLSDMAGYIKSIQDKIIQSAVYPPEAAELGWEGTVKIRLMVLSDGTLAFATVEESSGYDAIDQSALNSVRNLEYPAFPVSTDRRDINMVIPIVYSHS